MGNSFKISARENINNDPSSVCKEKERLNSYIQGGS